MTSAAVASTPPTRWKYTVPAYLFVIGCWLVYAGLTLFAPVVANQRFHLGTVELLSLRLSIIIPIHLIWLMALSGAVALKSYANLINGGRESRAIHLIAGGLLWTIGYLAISSVVSAATPFFVHTSYYDAIIIFRDHLAPFASLVAFFFIYRGSHLLRDVAAFPTWTRATSWIMAGYALFCFLFVLQFSTAPILHSPVAGRTAVTIAPHSILLFTMIVPFLVAWFLGVLAVVNITKYAQHVKGLLYRQALRDLVVGICGVIAFAVVIQLISLAAKYLAELKLGPVLAIVYFILLLYGIGFLFVRSGAKKLVRIEHAK
jgi:hypothetical protein